ncbi:phosphomannomutase [Sphingobium wenxiniae]|uniref:Phosphomannomutase n=1 Tax=Sphingobium wenxiniae (strain DSM 21828 / CGMCC 1.7748 / JZ-1) TaxID=595605 RepID=A0A562K8S2_SPHWJ|nr:phosphomannomutase/phosphoglucomutase [Sphingobium wenxiniae]MBB6192417.1 phosphomannomutase [Sphingobium wenxiniae]TWH91787.1 phosphomannomutase [Sphingobium wenxiniae]
MTHLFHPSLLREYDMRGVVGETLGAEDAYAVGRTFGTLIGRAGGSAVAVGRDGRLSSPMLETALVRGLADSGVDVLRIGLGPTPMLYFAEAEREVMGGIQITGSHNPRDHNGFKLVFQHRPFFGEDIQQLGGQAAAGDWRAGSGRVDTVDLLDAYVARLMRGFDGGAFRIGWDTGNGAAGPAVEKLTQLLPGEHHLLFTDIDGNFPHHHPDPSEERNLADLKALVLRNRLHFGLAFDGDGDRIGVVDGQGRAIWGDQLLSIFAQDVLKDHPGAAVIADVKASQTLFDQVEAWGGVPLMWKTGHSQIKSRMKETGSLLAGEMTGHVFFADDYYGFDDGLYAAVRLIRTVSRLGRSVAQLRDAMPVMANTPELRFPVEESRKFAVVDEVLARLRAAGAAVDDTDGARVRTADGWWLLRASNTQNALVARAEAKDASALDRLIAMLDSHLAESGVIRPRS